MTITSIPTENIATALTAYPNSLSRLDFSDCYAISLSPTEQDKPIESLYIAIMNNPPKWIQRLMALRNQLMRPFGLKTEITGTDNQIEIGQRMGQFTLMELADNHIITGEDDKHLDFRVLMYREDNQLFVNTQVQWHNTFGKLYLTSIKPFHILIVKSLLKRYLKHA